MPDFDGKIHHIEKGVEIILPINSYHCHPVSLLIIFHYQTLSHTEILMHANFQDFYEQPQKFNPQRFMDGVGDLKTLKEAGKIFQEVLNFSLTDF